jgi:hypothetical protein
MPSSILESLNLPQLEELDVSSVTGMEAWRSRLARLHNYLNAQSARHQAFPIRPYGEKGQA